MKVSVLVFLILLLACTPALALEMDGNTSESRVAYRGEVLENITLEKAQALERRAATLDAMGDTERASRLREMVARWEEKGSLDSRPKQESPGPLPSDVLRAQRSDRGSMICTSPWSDDVLIYQGDYAYNLWLYGNSFAVDYDSSGHLFAAVGLADSSVHLFYSDDIGATWSDEMTITFGIPELQTQLDLVVSDEGDSTLLNLFYLYPGYGHLRNVKIDYSTWTQISNPLIDDTVTSYWAIKDQYWGIDYFLHTVYDRYGYVNYTWSDDRGTTWDTPYEVGSEISTPMIAYGGYSGDGYLYLSSLWLPGEDTTSLWVTRSTDYGTTWELWQLVYGSSANDVVDAVLAATHNTDPDLQIVHALMSVNIGAGGNYNLWLRTSTDGGASFSSRPGIAYDAALTEHLPSVDVFRGEDASTFYCAYYMDDTTSGAFDSLMFVYTDTDDWEAEKPGIAINESLYAVNIRPQITFGAGVPGIAYAGAAGVNVYYDNLWFTGVSEGRRTKTDHHLSLDLLQCSPNPFRERASISYMLPSRGDMSLKVYDSAGRFVRTLFDGTQNAGAHSVVWDGLDAFGNEAPAGIYIYRLSTGAGVLSRKLVLVR